MEYLRTIFLCFFIFSFVYLFIFSFATYSSVVLNEVAIQPNQTVELYNSASESADISSWYIDDAGGSTYFTIPPQTILPPQSCLLFNSDFNFNKSSADSVRLFNSTSPPTSSSAQLAEQYSYVKAPETHYSFSKKIDGGGEWFTDVSSLGLSNESLILCVPTETPLPTPTSAPSTTVEPTQTPSPTSEVQYHNIFISEVYPYPQSNEHEWIELYNNNDLQVDLVHWYIDDAENTGSAPKSFSLKIDPYTYAVVDISTSLFNNSGDVARLLDSDKNEKDSMEYGKMTQGKSMGRITFGEDSYCEQEQSKNTANSSCLSEPPQTVSSQSTQNTVKLTKKSISPTKKPVNQPPQQTNTGTNLMKTTSSKQEGEILGVQMKEIPHTSPTPYLTFVSFSYSLLTIASIFIKMKNA